MKYACVSPFISLMCLVAIAGSAYALPLYTPASLSPSEQHVLIVQCGVPSEFVTPSSLRDSSLPQSEPAPAIEPLIAAPSTPVPDPSSLALLGTGLGLWAGFRGFRTSQRRKNG